MTVVSVELTKGFAAIIDEDDHQLISQYKWCYSQGYAVTWDGNGLISMHRMIMNYYGELDIDHINNNGIDNRRVNLRLVSRTINNLNRKFKPLGVKKRVLADGSLRYDARIQWNGFQRHLGTFNNEEEAVSIVAEARELIIDGAKYLKVVKSPNRWSPPSECIEYEDGTYEWTEKSDGAI